MKRAPAVYVFFCFFLFVVFVSAQPGKTPEEKLERGRELLQSEKRDEAFKLLGEAVVELRAAWEADPKDARAAFLLGKAYFYLEEHKEALATFEKAIELAPKAPGPHLFKGLLLRRADDLVGSAKELRTACDLSPKDPECWTQLGRTLGWQSKQREALAAYRKAFELDPNHAEAIYNAGAALFDLGRQDEALALFLRVLEVRPGSVNAAYSVGQVYQNMGKHDESLAHFLTAARLDPLNWRARAKIIQEYQALGRIEERDKARADLFALRKKGEIEPLSRAKFYCRDQFSAADKKVMVLEYFELEGDRALKYAFLILDKAGRKKQFEISLGSYEVTNAIFREQGDLKEGERVFHLDGYFAGGEHRTYGFFTGEPGYDVVRAIVVEILQGKRPAIGATIPDRGASK